MSKLLMIARETEEMEHLSNGLARDGLACRVIPPSDDLAREIVRRQPDLVLVELGGPAGMDIKKALSSLPPQAVPVIVALVPVDMLDSINGSLTADDFVVSPYNHLELALRMKKLLAGRTGDRPDGEIIKYHHLTIDRAACDVKLDGIKVELTFKEYELLSFLATNPGHVFSRQALLDRVWGYDYYGGDRTVDVHIRRLRSKIEDGTHTFVETVRNIGYRFKNK
jgi:DNA-binding response OmpR family regulator